MRVPRNHRDIPVTAVLVLLLSACTPSEPLSETEASSWVGTITTEGNVTTVVNESGSVWGGTATLVEEASIGVASGEGPYMLGRVTGVYATADEIFVVDQQASVVRVYDMDGTYLRDLGREGQGPGEFQYPAFVTGDADNRVFVQVPSSNRINVYGPERDAVASWPIGSGFRCCLHPMMMRPDGALWVEASVFKEMMRYPDPAIQAVGPEGPVGEPVGVPDFEYEKWTYTSNGRQVDGFVPFAPGVHWNIHPAGLVAGASDRYRFEILAPDGHRTIVERVADPVPVSDAEADFWREQLEQQLAREAARTGNTPSWDGRIPATKSAFVALLASYSGEVWVMREKPAEMIPECEPGSPGDLAQAGVSPKGVRLPGSCFTISYSLDVFDANGRYLGPVDATLVSSVSSFIRADVLITPTQDEAGTIMVKRYRLVLPGER